MAKARAKGKEGAITAEEKRWYIGQYGRQPPRGC